MEPLYLSHYTLATCLGLGQAANWNAIAQQKTGLESCDFETISLPTYIGKIRGLEDIKLPERLSHHICRNNQLALTSLEQDHFNEHVFEAIKMHGKHRIGVFLGTSTSGILNTEIAYRHRDSVTGALPENFRYEQTHNTHSVSNFVRDYFELEGPAVTVSSACSSSAKVFGNAARMMACGLIDAAIVGGVDSLCLTTLYGFNSLELLSPEKCRPYDKNRNGISISEAAGFALLTRNKPNHTKVIAITGIGESSDAHHMSSPHPSGDGALAAMKQAIAMAGRNIDQVDYINLHGTATRSNDAAEGLAVATLFGNSVPCSSTKGHTGHALGAAGIVEITISALAMENHTIVGGINTREVDQSIQINYQLKNIIASPKVVMSNSFGFGGSNCSVLMEIA